MKVDEGQRAITKTITHSQFLHSFGIILVSTSTPSTAPPKARQTLFPKSWGLQCQQRLSRRRCHKSRTGGYWL